MVGEPKGTLDHHFLEGRKYRADDIGEVIAQRNWWRIVAVGEMGVIGLAIVGLIYLGTLPKWTPFIIKWDSSTGELTPVGVHPRAGEEPITLRLLLREFVITLRGISTDREVMRDQWKVAMKRVTKEGRARLVTYAETRKPLEQSDPISVEILHVLHTTGRTWQVRWEEKTYGGTTGQLVKQERLVGAFTYQHATPRTFDEITYNPGGVFFHEWSWSYE
ncbi:MAG TPA: VirB8/TrbF family protein [Candidatus Tectomicrobia bacterium]